MKNIVRSLAGLLTVIGALNWGLVGLFDFNLVHRIFGGAPMVEKWAYIAIGISALIFAALEATETNL